MRKLKTMVRSWFCKHSWKYGGVIPGPPGAVLYRLVCVRCAKEMAAVGIGLDKARKRS
jgi:hypothetical protein